MLLQFYDCGWSGQKEEDYNNCGYILSIRIVGDGDGNSDVDTVCCTYDYCDCCGDDDNINFAKIGDSTKRLEYDYEGGD